MCTEQIQNVPGEKLCDGGVDFSLGFFYRLWMGGSWLQLWGLAGSTGGGLSTFKGFVPEENS